MTKSRDRLPDGLARCAYRSEEAREVNAVLRGELIRPGTLPPTGRPGRSAHLIMTTAVACPRNQYYTQD